MFGKDYNKEISDLISANNKSVKSIDNIIKEINSLKSLFSSIQEDIIQIAKVQANHKEIITFLLNHTSVDADTAEDTQKDFFEMLKKIKETEEKK